MPDRKDPNEDPLLLAAPFKVLLAAVESGVDPIPNSESYHIKKTALALSRGASAKLFLAVNRGAGYLLGSPSCCRTRRCVPALAALNVWVSCDEPIELIGYMDCN